MWGLPKGILHLKGLHMQFEVCNGRVVQQGRDFSIVFRTFGADIKEVVDEMNMFATGQHPCYPEVNIHHRPDSKLPLKKVVEMFTIRCLDDLWGWVSN